MADVVGDDNESRRMDLNLYLAPPRNSPPRILDLGSDLFLCSLPMPYPDAANNAAHAADAGVVDAIDATSAAVDAEGTGGDASASVASALAVETVDEIVEPDRLDSPAPPDYVMLDTPYSPHTSLEYSPFTLSYLPNSPYSTHSPSMLGRRDVPIGPVYSPYSSSLRDSVPPSPTNAPPLSPVYSPLSPPHRGRSDSPPSPVYSPVSPSWQLLEHNAAYSPAATPPSPYVAAPPVAESTDELGFSFHLPMQPVPPSELVGLEDGSSSQREVHVNPEVRLGRLISTRTHHLRLRQRQLRSLGNNSDERSNVISEMEPSQEQPVYEASQAPEQLEGGGNGKVIAERAAVGTEEEGKEQRRKCASNFECNICFEMANDPVVTSCGHLYCWPCLYQWICVYTDHKECPVCKGEVTEANITPIYGRGGSDSVEKKNGVPARPHGNRHESFRQQLRPISRRLGEGLVSSWRRIIDQQMANAGRFERHDQSFQEMLDTTHRRALARWRVRRLQRVAGLPSSGSVTLGTGVAGSEGNTTSHLHDGVDFWHQISLLGFAGREGLTDVLTAANLQRVAAPVVASSYQHRASNSSSNPPNHEPPVGGSHVAAALTADQVSASSTFAVIQGDVDVSDSPGEPTNAGPSRSQRRRGRSSNSGTLNADGRGIQFRKRRREN